MRIYEHIKEFLDFFSLTHRRIMHSYFHLCKIIQYGGEFRITRLNQILIIDMYSPTLWSILEYMSWYSLYVNVCAHGCTCLLWGAFGYYILSSISLLKFFSGTPKCFIVYYTSLRFWSGHFSSVPQNSINWGSPEIGRSVCLSLSLIDMTLNIRYMESEQKHLER